MRKAVALSAGPSENRPNESKQSTLGKRRLHADCRDDSRKWRGACAENRKGRNFAAPIPSPRRGLSAFLCWSGGWHHRLIFVTPPASKCGGAGKALRRKFEYRSTKSETNSNHQRIGNDLNGKVPRFEFSSFSNI